MVKQFYFENLIFYKMAIWTCVYAMVIYWRLFSYSKRFESFPLEDWLNWFIYIMKRYVVVRKNEEALYILILNTFIIYVQWKKVKYNTAHRICYLSIKVGRMRLLSSEFLTSAQWALKGTEKTGTSDFWDWKEGAALE